MKFKTVLNKTIVDLIPYCLERKINPTLRVHIGCDSVRIADKLIYITCVVFRYGPTGAHFVYKKDTLNNYKSGDGKPDLFTKLWQEARFAIETAEYLIENKIFQREDIVLEFDYNNIKKTLSTPLIPSTTGWATGLGYKNILLKLEQQIACKAANHICQFQ